MQGSNSGEYILEVAKKFRPRALIGVEIDGKLAVTARKNHEQLFDDFFPMVWNG